MFIHSFLINVSDGIYFIKIYIVGYHPNYHSNKNIQASIKSYHTTLKHSMKIKKHQFQGHMM